MGSEGGTASDYLVFCGANVVRRAVLKLTMTASRLVDGRKFIARFYPTAEEGIAAAREILETQAKSA